MVTSLPKTYSYLSSPPLKINFCNRVPTFAPDGRSVKIGHWCIRCSVRNCEASWRRSKQSWFWRGVAIHSLFEALSVQALQDRICTYMRWLHPMCLRSTLFSPGMCVCVCVYVMDLRLFMHACWMAAPELKNRQAGFSFVKLTVCVCKHMQTPFYEEILMKTQNPVEICLCIPWAKAHHVLTCFDPACIRRKGRRWRTAWSNETRRDVVQLACLQYFPSWVVGIWQHGRRIDFINEKCHKLLQRVVVESACHNILLSRDVPPLLCMEVLARLVLPWVQCSPWPYLDR